MVFDWDDFGVNHIISDACQSHDCRKQLDALHYANPAFKATLFAIPHEMTKELLEWCKANETWIELAVHGVTHSSNTECEKMTYEEFDDLMSDPLIEDILEDYFTKGFKAPGWQISDKVYEWLLDNGYWVADQSYNDERRPKGLRAYVVNGRDFFAHVPNKDGTKITPIEGWHGHVWNCMGNGIEETFEHVEGLVKAAKDFKFVSEVL